MLSLINGNSVFELRKLKERSIDAIICDPPYGIGINGEEWDKALPSNQIWSQCFRVLKPGGFIVATSGSRLYHRMATQIEKSGFISHQMMVWAYASGMPKGMNLGAAIKKHESRSVPTDKFRKYLRTALDRKNLSASRVERMLEIKGMFSHYLGKSQPQFPSEKVWKRLQFILDLKLSHSEVIEKMGESVKFNEDIATEKFESFYYGLQTLKPAIEPIFIGQKPCEKSYIHNMLKYKLGAYNINDVKKKGYPANFITDGSETVKRCLRSGGEYFESLSRTSMDNSQVIYCKKAKKDEFNTHPTVKPIKLFEHLIKLFTPKGGIVLDPFMGSGTTGLASLFNDRRFIGIEKREDYFEIAKRRLTLKDAA